MRRAPLAVSFAIAAACHAAVLYGFRWETAVRALPVGMDSAAVVLEFTAEPREEAPDALSAASAPNPLPAVPPEPVSKPEAAVPEPLPPPEPSRPPEPTAVSSTPPPVQPVAAVKHFKPRPPGAESSAPSSPQEKRGDSPGREANTGGNVGGVRVRSNPRPEYPAQARRERQEGVVFVAVEIDSDGKPVDVALERTSGFPLLDAAALRGVRRWRFEPASSGTSHAEVPIRFSLLP